MKILNFLKEHKTIIFISVLVFVIAAVYGRSITFDYVYFDDNILILEKNDILRNYKSIPKYFSESMGSFYRPLLNISFAIDSFVSGKNPFFYHLTNIVLHVIAVILMFILLNRQKFNKTAIYFFTLLFAVHPAFVQAVAWIPGRNDTLIAIFAFAALIFLSDYFDYGRKNVKIALFFLMCLFGLFTKETMIVMAVIAPAFVFLFCRNVSKRDYYAVTAGLLVLSCVYFTARYYVISGLGIPFDKIADNIFDSLPIFLNYIEFAVIPARIYLFNTVIPADIFMMLSLIAVMIPLTAALFLKNERKTVVVFGALWFVVFLLPTFISPEANYYYSHRFYLAAFGIVIMFLEFFTALFENNKFLKKYFIILFSALLCIFSVSSYLQSKKFTDRISFLQNSLIESPNLAVVHSEAGLHLAVNGEFEAAEKEMLRALEIEPGNPEYYENTGYIYMLEKDYARAEEVFENVLKKDFGREKSLYNLSQIYYISGEIENAYKLAERLISLFPNKGYNEYYLKVKNLYDKK
ncbi:MAG: hypothetical protein LBR69_00600 [Endomicrobium sp.]|jgi:hypothetical protein|nr:hypothetical protein [Endomicrobium sp.]